MEIDWRNARKPEVATFDEGQAVGNLNTMRDKNAGTRSGGEGNTNDHGLSTRSLRAKLPKSKSMPKGTRSNLFLSKTFFQRVAAENGYCTFFQRLTASRSFLFFYFCQDADILFFVTAGGGAVVFWLVFFNTLIYIFRNGCRRCDHFFFNFVFVNTLILFFCNG